MLNKRLLKLERLAFPEKRDPVTVCLDFGKLGKNEITVSKAEWLKIKRGMIQSGAWVETPDGGLNFVIQKDDPGECHAG